MGNWKEAFENREDLSQYDDNGLALFGLALKFGVEDLETIASDAITDGSDDKKCDMVYINSEEEYAVIAQCYMSSKDKKEAPANKASDLNTAIGWLLQRNINEVPERIKSAAKELRSCLKDKTVKRLHIWYIHNLPESQNVENELITVQQTATSILEADFTENKLKISAIEVGKNTLTEWYEESQSPILVNEVLEIDFSGGYEIKGQKWKSFSTSIPAQFLYRMYKKHKTKIFSANIRDYLGARSTDSNINNGIRKTIEEDPGNFWVFNNGLTILTHEIIDSYSKKLKIKGFSIVNGAQTTGAIGSLNKLPDKNTLVQARFVATTDSDTDLIHSIIRYNNSQNKVEASDFRSTDKIQKRLKQEFDSINSAEYEGGRRGGSAEVIRRRANLLPSYTVGQALACINLEPIIAYNQKSAIWINDRLYSKYFNEQTKAAHIVFAYSLLKSVESKKQQIVDKSKKSNLTAAEEDYLAYFRQRGSIFLFSSAIASCLEIFLERKVPNIFRISFGNETSPAQAEVIWLHIIDVTVPFCNQLNDGLDGGLKNTNTVNKVMRTFRSLVQATASANNTIYQSFAKEIKAP
ncbi:putative abortive infection phage resistance protein [Marivirga lumbricoides]|uniref:Abortive infection phage resistance protein n=1 Tax=Marivirga lumbricoides TaxID=1046115 RepID=A0ABQ1LCG6_9BACT|nr:putative abortive infection phage resistance protein [Marivirga lumbricoides]